MLLRVHLKQLKYSFQYIRNYIGASSCIMSSPAIAKEPTHRPFRVSIEGNIGAGKSTLIKHFSNFPDVDLHMEPVSEWCNVKGHNLLDLLYKDINKNNFMFQHYVQLSRLKIQTHKTDKKVHLFERSLQNNRYCFVEMSRKAGHLSESEYVVLCSWYEWIEQQFDINLDLIEENTVSLEYLKQLHQAYEDWLLHSKVPVLQINADKSLDQVKELYLENQDFILGHNRMNVKLASLSPKKEMGAV
ncbi:Deoxynucleoside kinase [Blattella germanica]|nr:Deoxynucleoside kinase [Blattella germanica]